MPYPDKTERDADLLTARAELYPGDYDRRTDAITAALEVPAIRPLPSGLRSLLLAALDAGYRCDCPQTRLRDAPDAAIAWQVQSMLDDYASYEARRAVREAA